jgi:hypothetical protein
MELKGTNKKFLFCKSSSRAVDSYRFTLQPKVAIPTLQEGTAGSSGFVDKDSNSSDVPFNLILDDDVAGI